MEETEEQQAQDVLGDNYKVLKARLERQSQTLFQKSTVLNGRRKSIFGDSVFALQRKHKIITENNCVPVDMSYINGNLLLGYNVYVGLRKIDIEDTFAMYRFEDDRFSVVSEEDSWNFLHEEQFLRDYKSLLSFNKNAKLIQFRMLSSKFLVIFQTGSTYKDSKVFRWISDGKGGLHYKDEFGGDDNVFPVAHDFEWIDATPDDFVRGTHPHISIKNKLFVETVGGDLTIKVENNTEDGEGIYSEPVEDPHQTLDDSKVSYAFVGQLVVLRIAPRAEDARYFVFNTLTNEVVREDSIGLSCIQLPEHQGLIFPRGYVLSEGSFRIFSFDTHDLEYKSKIVSPNGEDVLFVYLRRRDGHYLLLQYNMVNKEVRNPIECHGYSFFDDGTLAFFWAKDEPTTTHEVQIWSTPFCSDAYHSQTLQSQEPSFLRDIGNAELVRAISDVQSLNKLVFHPEPTANLYHNLVRSCDRVVQDFSWISHEEGEVLDQDIAKLRATSGQIIDEFEKVADQKKQANKSLRTGQGKIKQLLLEVRPENFRSISQFMEGMGILDRETAGIRGLETVKYIDRVRLTEQVVLLEERMMLLCTYCAKFLQQPDAFKPLLRSLEDMERALERVKKTKEIKPLSAELETVMDGLNVLTDAKERLQVDDIEVQTKITQSIQEVRRRSNQVKFALDNQKKKLREKESLLQFSADISLFDSELEGGLARAETPEDCDEELSRISGLLDDLDARFGDVDDFVDQIDEKREVLQSTLFSKKQQLLEKRQQRVARLFSNGKQIITGLADRKFADVGALKNFFATDRRVQRVQKLSVQIADLLDNNKSEELLSTLKSTEQDALRTLRDTSELFEEGSNLIKLGSHRFAINTQPFELTIAPYEEGVALHITNTDFHESIEDVEFLKTKKYWNQALVSENDSVYRGAYLAASMMFAAEKGEHALTMSMLEGAEDLSVKVRDFGSLFPNAGYVKGVHDEDATKILRALLRLRKDAGSLRFSARSRAAGVWWWISITEPSEKEKWKRRAKSFVVMKRALGAGSSLIFAQELRDEIREHLTENKILKGISELDLERAGMYLIDELAQALPRFVLSALAAELDKKIRKHLHKSAVLTELMRDIKDLSGDRFAQVQLVYAWLDAAITALEPDARHVIDELVVYWCTEPSLWQVHTVNTQADVVGLQGQHVTLQDGVLHVRYDAFIEVLTEFYTVDVPGFQAYRALRHQYLIDQEKRLRLSELRPRVLTSFVRNKLINDVYLHLIGDNLAKQIGASGADKRTDLMGMLLLISPPGYGKTTLMEYVASRLGMAFVKVNGPSIGHEVVSLDPSEAPNATARQEVEKINLGFEMANNVMLYLDDIQHTDPELLQKFISLCDGQRRVEGVWRGRTRTYDLRGKRFCVVMAGNPYTETGDKFQIPDMLANRADIYNLGDQLSGKEHLFALSYIENALTSNRVLAPLSTRPQKDVYLFARMAEGEEISSAELSHDYSGVEREDIVKTMRMMMRCRDVLLRVNAQYIFAAAQDDRLRVEPPFKLQGSYRNMSKLSEKIAPAMNDAEVDALVGDHYRGESQTLTSGARANLLKLEELRGRLQGDDLAEWERIKEEFVTVRRMGGSSDDPVGRMTGSLSLISDQLKVIPQVLRAVQNPDLSDHVAQVHQELSNLKVGFQEDSGGLLRGLEEIRSTLERERDSSLSDHVAQVHTELSNLKVGFQEDSGGLLRGLEEIRSTLEKERDSSLSDHVAQVHTELSSLRADLHEDRGMEQSLLSLRGVLESIAEGLQQESSLQESLLGIQDALSNGLISMAVPQSVSNDNDHEHGPEFQKRVQNLLLREAQRFFQGGSLQVNSDPRLMGSLQAIYILIEQISARLRKVTKPQLHEQLMQRIQQDIGNTFED